MSKRLSESPSALKSKLKQRKIQPTINLRFEDLIAQKEQEVHQNEKAKNSKKTKVDLAHFSTFKLIDPKKIKLDLIGSDKTDEELEPKFVISETITRSEMTFDELVAGFFFDDETLDALVEHNSVRGHFLPAVMSKGTEGLFAIQFFFNSLFF